MAAAAAGAIGAMVMNRNGKPKRRRRRDRPDAPDVWARPGMTVTSRAELMPGREPSERTFQVTSLLPSGRVFRQVNNGLIRSGLRRRQILRGGLDDDQSQSFEVCAGISAASEVPRAQHITAILRLLARNDAAAGVELTGMEFENAAAGLIAGQYAAGGQRS